MIYSVILYPLCRIVNGFQLEKLADHRNIAAFFFFFCDVLGGSIVWRLLMNLARKFYYLIWRLLARVLPINRFFFACGRDDLLFAKVIWIWNSVLIKHL